MIQLITGGAGFIGSRYILQCINDPRGMVINLDALTYASDATNLEAVASFPNYKFVHGNIKDCDLVLRLLRRHKVTHVVNFAAESHVDNSIKNPNQFVDTNIQGTLALLQSSLQYFQESEPEIQEKFKFYQISTDEVYGSLQSAETSFLETSVYRPNSPYAASKAGADHLVRAFHQTYGLPVLISHCSNNYGPHQHEEKLIPRMIKCALNGEALPIYGDGSNIREWLHVDDHCKAIELILSKAKPGSVFNIGSQDELTNLDLVFKICALLEELCPRKHGKYEDSIMFVPDRPGHDTRYSTNWGKLKSEFGWEPIVSIEKGLKDTVSWYLNRLSDLIENSS